MRCKTDRSEMFGRCPSPVLTDMVKLACFPSLFHEISNFKLGCCVFSLKVNNLAALSKIICVLMALEKSPTVYLITCSTTCGVGFASILEKFKEIKRSIMGGSTLTCKLSSGVNSSDATSPAKTLSLNLCSLWAVGPLPLKDNWKGLSKAIELCLVSGSILIVRIPYPRNLSWAMSFMLPSGLPSFARCFCKYSCCSRTRVSVSS